MMTSLLVLTPKFPWSYVLVFDRDFANYIALVSNFMSDLKVMIVLVNHQCTATILIISYKKITTLIVLRSPSYLLCINSQFPAADHVENVEESQHWYLGNTVLQHCSTKAEVTDCVKPFTSLALNRCSLQLLGSFRIPCTCTLNVEQSCDRKSKVNVHLLLSCKSGFRSTYMYSTFPKTSCF